MAVQIPHGKGRPVVKYSNSSAVSCAKTAEPIEILFEIWTLMGPMKHVLGGSAHWRNLANTVEPSHVRRWCGLLWSYCDHLSINMSMKEKMKSLENCWDWKQSVWWLGKVTWDGLDTYNVIMTLNQTLYKYNDVTIGGIRQRWHPRNMQSDGERFWSAMTRSHGFNLLGW